MTALKVYKTAPAPVMAQWLGSILDQVIAAARLPSYPLEVRPTGKLNAWAESHDYAPDGRLCMSTKIAFWEAEKIASIYLHEAAHRLLEGHAVSAHGAEFLCLDAILLIRAADHFDRPSIEKLSFYDMADQPPELENVEFWQGQVLDWALQTAHELAPSETPAIDLAAIVCASWQQHIADQSKARQKAVFAKHRQAEERQSLKDSISLFRCLAAVGWTSFLLVASVFIFKN